MSDGQVSKTLVVCILICNIARFKGGAIYWKVGRFLVIVDKNECYFKNFNIFQCLDDSFNILAISFQCLFMFLTFFEFF